MLLKEWLKKTAYAEENELTYEIKVGFMLSYDGDNYVLEWRSQAARSLNCERRQDL